MKTTQDLKTGEIKTTFSTDEEKETVYNLIKRHIDLCSKAERKRNANWVFVKYLTWHGSGYSASICEALGVNPNGYEWIKVEEE